MANWDYTNLGWLFSTANTVIGAGAGAAIVQGGFAFYRDRYQRKSRASYMAMRLAVVLESHAAACCDLIARNEAEEPHPEERFTGDATLPAIVPYPEDADGWRAICPELARRCLEIRSKLDHSRVEIGSTGRFVEENRDYLGDLVKEKAARGGLDACKLSQDLRRRYKIKCIDEVLDCCNSFTEALTDAQKAQADRQGRYGEQGVMPGGRRLATGNRHARPADSSGVGQRPWTLRNSSLSGLMRLLREPHDRIRGTTRSSRTKGH